MKGALFQTNYRRQRNLQEDLDYREAVARVMMRFGVPESEFVAWAQTYLDWYQRQPPKGRGAVHPG